MCSLTAAYLLIFRRKTAHLRVMQRILVCNKVGIGIEIPNRLVYWLARPATALAYLASTRVSSGPKDSSLTADDSAAATTWRELAGRLNPDVVHIRAGPGAGERSRTPDLRITNALLYQLSYAGDEPAVGRPGSVIWCSWAGSNRRPLPYQGSALPTELQERGIKYRNETRA